MFRATRFAEPLLVAVNDNVYVNDPG